MTPDLLVAVTSNICYEHRVIISNADSGLKMEKSPEVLANSLLFVSLDKPSERQAIVNEYEPYERLGFSPAVPSFSFKVRVFRLLKSISTDFNPS